uniref:Intraflagellar transport protein 74 homolog n=1 Tax=Biomphalaria glabrata TaxID=6526 RepID=A0A2C9LAM1_BIOGL
MGRQPGTASRLYTAMNPTTARPGSRAGQPAGGIALNAQVTVVDRPTTQHGLGGMKTAAKGGRLVQDKSYYLGLVRSKINELYAENTKLKKEIENSSDENSSFLSYEKRSLILRAKSELSLSHVKQEAVRLYDQIHEFEVKRDALIEEAKTRGSPAEEREKLLKQVKEDNQEIASMERQTREIQEKIDQMLEDIQQLDQDIEENQGERNQKYKELKKREESMDEFLGTFEDNKMEEANKISKIEQAIITLLETMSRNMGRFTHLPTPKELMSMKADLQFKEDERQKSERTTIGLASEREKLQHDLQKMEQFEEKLNEELLVLREKVTEMEKELEVYSDLDKLKTKSEAKKQKLMDDRIILQKRRDNFKELIQALTVRYEGLKAQLNENETYTQLMNLEKKWQHQEQNNFSMKEFISQRTMDCDFGKTSKQVYRIMDDFNAMLQDQLAARKTY